MPRKCQICAHQKRRQIDKKIVDNGVYVRIAAEFGVPVKSIENHAKNHVKPLIAKANEQVAKEVIRRIVDYRTEVNLPPLEKVKMMQDRILTEMDSAAETIEKISLIREFRGWFGEEAKLCGLYQKDRENSETLEAVVGSFKAWLEDNPATSDQEKAVWLERFARRGGVETKQLAARVGVTVQEINQVQ